MAMNNDFYNDLYEKCNFKPDYEESRVPISGFAKDQRYCSMDWCISVADASAIGAFVTNKDRDKKFISISANNLLDWCYNLESTECYEWFTSVAFVRLKRLGGVPETLRPFENGKRKARPRTLEEQRAAIYIGGYEFLLLNEIELMRAIKQYPIVAEMCITEEYTKLGKNDFYKPKLPPNKQIGDMPLHKVMIYGWGYDPIEDIRYWKFRNSLGNDWGNGGCGRIIRQSSATNEEQSIIQPIRPTF